MYNFTCPKVCRLGLYMFNMCLSFIFINITFWELVVIFAFWLIVHAEQEKWNEHNLRTLKDGLIMQGKLVLNKIFTGVESYTRLLFSALCSNCKSKCAKKVHQGIWWQYKKFGNYKSGKLHLPYALHIFKKSRIIIMYYTLTLSHVCYICN